MTTMDAMDTMKPSELLTGAILYVEEKGWVQGSGTGEHGEVCALMAVRMTALQRHASAGLVATASRALEEVASELYSLPLSIPVFNDLACHEQNDAVAWMEKARAKLQERGQ